MSSKDKEISKSKFKLFLKTKTAVVGGGNANTGNTTAVGALSSCERLLRTDVERELRPEQPMLQRCRLLKELADMQLYNLNLDEVGVTRLWDLTKDLIAASRPTECRHTTLAFYKKLIHSQYKNLTVMREQFFSVIQNHNVPEDLRYRLELLDTLTENGKDINNFEEKVGKFMLNWMSAIEEANLLRPFLDILVNLIKFNAAHLDNDTVVAIVQNACHLSCIVDEDEIGLQCLTILEMVTSYTIFPSDPLSQCVVTVCRTVNHAPYCQASWKIMKNLLGTQLGYHAMKIMCNILNDRSLYDDQQLLRGAVFHLNMTIFGSNVVFQGSPMFYATTVLTSFLCALDSRQDIVTYEVILSMRKVIKQYKSELPVIIWDRICDIMTAIVNNIEYYERINIAPDRLQNLYVNFHETIDAIEQLLQEEQNLMLVNTERIYNLIERVADTRSEESVLQLIEYRSSKVTPTRPEWLAVLNEFVRRFYRMSSTNVRVKTIQALMHIMDLNRASYEEEILERVVIPLFSNVAHEPDLHIRLTVVKALVDFAHHCDTKRCGELLDILKRIINRPFDNQQSALVDIDNQIKGKSDIVDIIAAVDGLIDIFVIKLYSLPSSHAIEIFNILIGHLEQHYERPKVFEHTNIVRYKIFQWMLRARANSTFHIGYPDLSQNGAIKFSYFLGVDSNLAHETNSMHQQHQSFTVISIRRACKIIIKCLECVHDIQIFQLVIKELPKILQNKALIQGNDIEALACAFFKICKSSDEQNALVLPAIASLVIYNQHIQLSHQYNIISAITKGFISSVANVCINTMASMILEMPKALMRTLPEILLQMSRMSDTTIVSVPVLEFLSILSRLSNDLFTNFIPRHYMYVFAISLPYTKPHRYDHYTVSLAHHVIAGWFLKCKLELRKTFVPYIINSIQSNASMLYDDINKLRHIQRQDFNSLNEDSSNRKRSTSLTERGSRKTRSVDSDMRPLLNDNLKSFHAELEETCIDFLARHTYSPCSTLPKRLPAMEYLLKDGSSQTWLVGHNLVTITTSGCPSAPTRNGLCDRCAQLGRAQNLLPTGKSEVMRNTVPVSPDVNIAAPVTSMASTTAATTSIGTNMPERRYTKVSLQYSSGNESAGSTDLTSSSSSTSAVVTSGATTQRQTSNSSCASLEALSRRGSNPEALTQNSEPVIPIGRSNTSLLGNSISTTSISASTSPVQQTTCVRACTGWAEIVIRRPTGNISWITRIQNPMANDCFGHELPFSNMAALFMPTLNGGVFGPDFAAMDEDTLPIPLLVQQPSLLSAQVGLTRGSSSSHESLTSSNAQLHEESASKSVISAKFRALQRQEEISGTSAMVSAAIDIPKPAASSTKRGKDVLCGSVSDGEVDDEVSFDNEHNRTRNPVRRVNSSPEMSTSWRSTLRAAKPISFSQIDAPQQKKKIVQYTKDTRVSCEAIPEEIPGSTPPQPEVNPTAIVTVEAYQAPEMLDATLPPKQHSADDVNFAVNMLQSSSSSSLKLPYNKPTQSTVPPQSPRLEQRRKLMASSSNAPALKSGLAKSSSGGGGIVGKRPNIEVDTSSVSIDYGAGNNQDMMRGRSKTISVVREVNGRARPPASSFRAFDAAKTPPINSKLCMNPSFVFMQLYHTGQLSVTDTPFKVPLEEIKVLTLVDLVPPFETHSIGVLFVGKGQCNVAVEILRNSHGSLRYVEFLRNLGTLISLKDIDQQKNLFVGSLDKTGADGKFTYVWKDDIVQVTFHVATLMPTNLKKDPNCNEKKKHIGNDYVSIIYNESGEEYKLNTITGQCNYACVIVEPLELNTNRVYVKARPEISKVVCHPEPKIVSDASAPILARQLALHANMASRVYHSLQTKNAYPYASNWVERLRHIKRLRAKLMDLQSRQQQSSPNANLISGVDLDEQQSDALRKQTTNRDFTRYT